MLCSIYKIVNLVNGKVYIGQTWNTIKQRWFDHKKPSGHNCLKLHRAIMKHGTEKFTQELLTVCATQESSDYWESYFIKQYDSIELGYNIRTGGSRGKMSVAQRKAVGDFHRGKTMSEDSKNKMAKSQQKLTSSQIQDILKDTRFAKVIAKDYGVSKETIFRIKRKSLRCYQTIS
jgi:group I intron endonuclease